jgi:hypothetical protein
MPRNFDEERQFDPVFIIRGESFRMKIVRPEVIAEWEDSPIPEKSVDAIKYIDDKLKQFIENTDGSHERWDALRAKDDDPVSMGELDELLRWMVETQSARPTAAPSPSAPGRGRTAASSKAG